MMSILDESVDGEATYAVTTLLDAIFARTNELCARKKRYYVRNGARRRQ